MSTTIEVALERIGSITNGRPRLIAAATKTPVSIQHIAIEYDVSYHLEIIACIVGTVVYLICQIGQMLRRTYKVTCWLN